LAINKDVAGDQIVKTISHCIYYYTPINDNLQEQKTRFCKISENRIKQQKRAAFPMRF
jgi:hypothetical protein